MAEKIEIIVGTYEEFLLGYKVEKIDDNYSLIQSFATRSHTGSVRSLAGCGKYIASGGADDRIFIYDMKTRKETHVLIHHNGTVNAIAFTPDGTHILSGGDDGQMVAVRTNSWQTDAVWKKAHGGSPVTHISCHPTGKLALTLGNDLSLRTWNLIKGRTVYTTNLKSKKSLGITPDCLSWSKNGEYFTITGPRVIEIWSVQTAGIVKEQICESKPISVCWISEDIVVIGLEDGKIIMLPVKNEMKTFEAHQRRVKSMCFMKGILTTASSSGEICIWSVDIKDRAISKLASTNIGCRPTCITLLDITQFGDDYVVIKEEESVENTTLNRKNQTEKKQSVGIVKVEYENELQEGSDLKNIEIKESRKKRKHKKSEISSEDNDNIKVNLKKKKKTVKSSNEKLKWKETTLPIDSTKNQTKKLKSSKEKK